MSTPNYEDFETAGHLGGSRTYKGWIAAWGHEIVHHELSGGYQGSHYFLLRRDDGQYTVIDQAFGTCSHCDLLAGASHDELVKHFERKRRDLTWGDPDTVIDKVRNDEGVYVSRSYHDYTADDFVEAIEQREGQS